MVFPIFIYGCESWTVKKAECQRIDAFELWCWRRLLRVPWTARRANQSILKEISLGCSLEGLMLRLKLQYFGHLMWRVDSLEKTLMLGGIRVFPNESILHMRWPKYWSFSLSISPSKEHQGLISFRIDWFNLHVVEGTFKSLLQHHSSKASILLRSAFFTVQLSHPYMNTGKTIALTRWTFVGKVMSLPFNMLSSFVITFLPRSCNLSDIIISGICLLGLFLFSSLPAPHTFCLISNYVLDLRNCFLWGTISWPLLLGWSKSPCYIFW